MSEPVWVPLGAQGVPKAVYPIDFRNPQVAANPGNAYPLVSALTAWESWAWAFSATAEGRIYGLFRCAENLQAGMTGKFHLDLASAGAGPVVTALRWQPIPDGATLNPGALGYGPVTTTSTLVARARKKEILAQTVTIGTHMSPGDLVVVEVRRLPADAADTNASPLELLYGALVID